MIVFSCPTCRNTMQVPPVMAGHPVTCPFCHHPVLAPLFVPAHAPQPEPLRLEDPIDDDEQERRTLAFRAARDAKQKRKALIYIGCGIAFALIGVVFLVALWTTLMTDVRGAKPLTTTELLSLKEADAEDSPWVTYTGEQVIETDLGIETKGKYTNEQTRFVLVPIQDRWLIAERPLEEKGNRLEGKLEVWDGGLSKQAADKIKARHPELKDKWLPVQLSASQGGASTSALIQLVVIGAFVVMGLGCALHSFVSLPRKRPTA